MPPTAKHRQALEDLNRLDPDLAAAVQNHLDRLDAAASAATAVMLAEDVIWALEREFSFGQAIAAGYLELLPRVEPADIEEYHRLVRTAGDRGTTVGCLMARHLVPVITARTGSLLRLFIEAVAAMQSKGTYTLPPPLEALSQLLNSGDRSSAAVFLKLLSEAFAATLTYTQSQRLSVDLSQAALSFPPSKRVWQLEQLARVMRADVRLGAGFLEGMRKGLQLLSPAALDRFVAAALDKHRCGPASALAFLALASRQGCDRLEELQVGVTLREMETRLNRYLAARTGLRITVRPLSALDGRLPLISPAAVTACTDGRFIYLPEEMAYFGRKSANAELYRCLVRFESGLHEFGTFEFDLERLFDRCRTLTDCRNALDALRTAPRADGPVADGSDLERFCNLFPVPALAADLFTVFEHGRIRRRLGERYPGLIRAFLPILQAETEPPRSLLEELYGVIALGLPSGSVAAVRRRHPLVPAVLSRFVDRSGRGDCRAESSGELVVLTYDEVAIALCEQRSERLSREGYRPLRTPFDRRLRADWVPAGVRELDRKALAVKEKLAEKGLRVYRADLRRHLEDHQGVVCAHELAALLEHESSPAGPGNRRPPPSADELSVLLAQELPGLCDTLPVEEAGDVRAVTWHREWDCRLADYLNDHTRVRDRSLAGGDSRFYRDVLQRHHGLVQRIRKAFELLKPEGLKLHRQWIEGDAFDYRALIDFVMDKKAGLAPSERLYIKRLKVNRDVAVLLLVDLSRSTAHPVAGSTARVLDVAKEAIVLFSEALQVVGDPFAIAGFSGNGRLGVDYFHVKDFEESMNRSVRNRIDAMEPQRNTRMGAAIRHAATQFAAVSSRVRLLIILGDGFPNDLDYKKRYAVEDTRRAISELRSRHIHVHAITINIQAADNGRLDDLYGEIHHNLIAEIGDLPEKLWRIYGVLTR